MGNFKNKINESLAPFRNIGLSEMKLEFLEYYSSLDLYQIPIFSDDFFFQSSGRNASPISSLIDADRRKRNRTFIDPVSEVPRLEGCRIFQPNNSYSIYHQPKLFFHPCLKEKPS